MMASRKAVLDKNKQQLLDSVNASNKIYTNEELSILLAEQREKIRNLELVDQTLSSKIDAKKDKVYDGANDLKIYNQPYGGYYHGFEKYAVIKLGNAKFSNAWMVWLRLNIYQYTYSNEIMTSAYFYTYDDVFYSPVVSFLQKNNTVPVYFGRDNNKQIYLILDISGLEYFGIWVDQVTIMFGKNHEDIESGWNIYRTNDISNMTLVTRCGVL